MTNFPLTLDTPESGGLVLLGFDYGRKRIGVAVGQTLTHTACPLALLRVVGKEPDWAALSSLVKQWSPHAFVVGRPLTMDGADQPLSREARSFGHKLQKRYGLPVHEVDERFSSLEARSRQPGRLHVDPIAAQILTESWLAEHAGGGGGDVDPCRKIDTERSRKLLEQMCVRLKEKFHSCDPPPLMIGVQRGGVWVAEQLRKSLGYSVGQLNISFYRDDFHRLGLHPRVMPSQLPFSIENRHIILVDDVIHTGRTIRAAINEIFDYGRPAGIVLAVLIDRGGREIPVQPDVLGMQLDLLDHEHVKLSDPDKLELLIYERA